MTSTRLLALSIAVFPALACSNEALATGQAAATHADASATASTAAVPVQSARTRTARARAGADAAQDQRTVTQVQCADDVEQPQACQMRDSVGSDGTHTVTFQLGATTVRFVGKMQDGWWSGTLDGRPAMGYERNRGNVVFSTSDLSRSFAWWSPGNAHGSY